MCAYLPGDKRNRTEVKKLQNVVSMSSLASNSLFLKVFSFFLLPLLFHFSMGDGNSLTAVGGTLDER